MASARLTHGFVFCQDLDRLATFYEAALGFRREASAEPGFVMMRADVGADVAIHQVPDAIQPLVQVSDPPRWRDDTAYKLCFETDDLPALRAAVVAHGGQAKEPWSWSGTLFCECTDPEGNVVQLIQHDAGDLG